MLKLQVEDETMEYNEYFEDCFIRDFPWFTRDKLRTNGYYEWGDVDNRDIIYIIRELNVTASSKVIYSKIEINFVDLKYKLEDPRFLEKFSYFVHHNYILITYQGLVHDPFPDRWDLEKGRGKIGDDTLITMFIISPIIIEVVDTRKFTNIIIDMENLEEYYGDSKTHFLDKYKNMCLLTMPRKIYHSHKSMSEKELENFVEKQIHRVEDGMTVIKRQYEVTNGFIDILAVDKDGVKCIIELKIVGDCKDIIFQSAYYPTQFNEKVRMITMCPDYSSKILAALRSLNGVEIMTYYFKGSNSDPQLFVELVE